MSNQKKPLQYTAYLGWIIAAIGALAALWMGRLYSTEQAQNTILQQQQMLADLTLKGLQNQLEAERILSKYQLESVKRELETPHPKSID
jgi:hypothetical protein|uniref:hypothetical protein n=1 Tax=Cephaloticoccus sp. TaxID=1985742 RepID=UPI00404930FE